MKSPANLKYRKLRFKSKIRDQNSVPGLRLVTLQHTSHNNQPNTTIRNNKMTSTLRSMVNKAEMVEYAPDGVPKVKNYVPKGHHYSVHIPKQYLVNQNVQCAYMFLERNGRAGADCAMRKLGGPYWDGLGINQEVFAQMVAHQAACATMKQNFGPVNKYSDPKYDPLALGQEVSKEASLIVSNDHVGAQGKIVAWVDSHDGSLEQPAIQDSEFDKLINELLDTEPNKTNNEASDALMTEIESIDWLNPLISTTKGNAIEEEVRRQYSYKANDDFNKRRIQAQKRRYKIGDDTEGPPGKKLKPADSDSEVSDDDDRSGFDDDRSEDDYGWAEWPMSAIHARRGGPGIF
jgi:hypothetical protein